MKKHNYYKLFITAILLIFINITSVAQCVIPVTETQPFIEDFEGDVFECWTVDEDGASWVTMTGSASTVAYFSYHNNGDEARLISPVLDMSAVSTVTFSFSFAMVGLYQNDELVVSYRASEDDPWHDLGTFSYSDYSATFEESYTLDNLSPTYQVSFLGRGLGGLYMMLDNIEIVPIGGCSRPVNLQATEITAFSALLGWSVTGNEESWLLEINGVPKTVDAQPYQAVMLDPQTDYTFRVKANCDNGMESDWSVPFTFKTLCDVITVTDEEPFYDDFEASEYLLCWQNEILSGEDSWVVDPGYLILNNTAFFIWLGGEARLISAPLDIATVTNPVLEFKYKLPHGYANDADELSVWYRTSTDDSWHFLTEYTAIQDDWSSVFLSLPNPSATYYICFKAKANNANGVYVDEVRVGHPQGVGVADIPTIQGIVSPNPATNHVVINANIDFGEVMLFDLTGRKMAAATLHDGRVELDLSGFAQGVYVARIIGENGSTTVQVVKE